MTRHLQTCLPAREPAKGKKTVRLFQIRAEGQYARQYWLYLEIPADAPLTLLDSFLRAVWVECCGHLSNFEIDGVRYEVDTGMVDGMRNFFGAPRAQSMRRYHLGNVLQVGQTFHYQYDYGTTTYLQLKVVGEREGPRPKEPVRLLARNYAPMYRCVRCGERAEWVNAWREYEPLCRTHAQEHPDGEDAFLPVVNSPRVGECGYTGPEDDRLNFEETAPPKPGRE